MIVWLWDADGSRGWRGQGISDDLTAAMQAVEGCLLGGRAETACVEAAQDILDRVTLAIAYRRLGHVWQAKRGTEGTIMWRALTRLDGGTVAGHYMDSGERVWASAKPWTGEDV